MVLTIMIMEIIGTILLSVTLLVRIELIATQEIIIIISKLQ